MRDLREALANANVLAFLRVLRAGETNQTEGAYRMMFGGELFDSFDDHPRRLITRNLGGKPITSSAAGAYQFLARTWDGLVKQYGFANFRPETQDLAAIALIKGRKALEDVIAGRAVNRETLAVAVGAALKAVATGLGFAVGAVARRQP